MRDTVHTAADPAAERRAVAAALPGDGTGSLGPGQGRSQDIYLDHFGLAQRPFALMADPAFLFWSDAHGTAQAMLEYGLVTRAPITLITGTVGMGKTLLLRHFARSVPRDICLGSIADAPTRAADLVPRVLRALRQTVTPGRDPADLLEQLQALLADEHKRGRRAVILIDEAQQMDAACFEELRMLTNLAIGSEEILQFVLGGLPALNQVLQQPEMAAVAQRVAARHHLGPMDAPTVQRYIAHRMTVAGGAADLFSRHATDLIQRATGGLPRLVNQLCDLALTYAFSAGLRRISHHTVIQVLDDGVFYAGGATLPLPLFA